MNELFDEIKNAIIKELTTSNKAPLTEKNLKISQDFHNKYYDKMYDKKVKVILKDGTEIIGYYNDEFYEECSIFVNNEVIKIADIKEMILIEE